MDQQPNFVYLAAKVKTMNAQKLVTDHHRDYWGEQSVSLIYVVMCTWNYFIVQQYIVAEGWSIVCKAPLHDLAGIHDRYHNHVISVHVSFI